MGKPKCQAKNFDAEALGRRLKKIRELYGGEGCTIEDWVHVLGIGRSTWSRYESAKRIPPADVLALICERLDVSPCWLLTGVSCGDPHITPSGRLQPGRLQTGSTQDPPEET